MGHNTNMPPRRLPITRYIPQLTGHLDRLLVWFVPNAGNKSAGHVGIYIGNGQFISATDNGVQIYDLTYWNSNIASYEGWGDAPANWPGR